MKCPIDTDIDLLMMDKQGVEIDYCPKCRGVWLDRGELDKLIEKTSGSNVGQTPPQSYSQSHTQHNSQEQYPHKKKKESPFADFFDF